VVVGDIVGARERLLATPPTADQAPP
jgi:hypothetical protein